MKKIILSIFLVFVFCTHSLAESSVWKIQNGDSVMYIGGTVHMLRQADFPLPEEFQKAYSLSDMLVFETDIRKMEDVSTQQKLLSKAMYTDGTTVEQHISAETYKLLNEYCSTNGIPLAQLKQFKPSIIANMMTVIELLKLGVAPEGVDMFFYKSALKDNKVIQTLETVDEQIDFIIGMAKGNEDNFIKYTIKDIKSTKENFEMMVDSWRKGDNKKLYELIVDDMKTKTPALYKNLITDRNNNWLPVIEKYFGNKKIEFILVGAAHVVGPEGLIEQLRKKGYKIEKL